MNGRRIEGGGESSQLPAPMFGAAVELAPPRWRGRIEQVGLDLRMLVDGALGRVAAPFVPRRGSRFDGWPTHDRAPGLARRRVRVQAIRSETPDAKTFVLRDEKLTPTPVTPGQFFTFELDVDGTRIRRAYSASHDCRGTDFFTVTVKRVPGGLASNFLHDHVREGDVLEVFGPSGSFTVAPLPEPSAPQRRRLVLIAGGSGITPMMAIARTLLAADPAVQIGLIYGNRARADVIFADAIDDLQAEHGARFFVRHVLEVPSAEGTEAAVGRLDGPTLGTQLDELEAQATGLLSSGTHYYVCGPAPMMDAARRTLRSRGVPEDLRHEERFSNPEARTTSTAKFEPRSVTALVDGKPHHFETQAGQTLLEAGLEAGLQLPYSCAMGGCAVCRVKLVEGDVETEQPNCLSTAEREAGYVLACVSRPRTRCTFEVSR